MSSGEGSQFATGTYLFQNASGNWKIDYSYCYIEDLDNGGLKPDEDVQYVALGQVVSSENGTYTVDVIGV